jgi:hypothetical protein
MNTSVQNVWRVSGGIHALGQSKMQVPQWGLTVALRDVGILKGMMGYGNMKSIQRSLASNACWMACLQPE